MYRALYDFESAYEGTLGFKAGDRFTVLERKTSDWWTVQNGYGELGYVPVTYLVKDVAEHCEVLRSIDGAIEAIHLQAANSGGHYTHQERENLQKLIKHRQAVVKEQRGEEAGKKSDTVKAVSKRQSSKRRAAPPPPPQLTTDSVQHMSHGREKTSDLMDASLTRMLCAADLNTDVHNTLSDSHKTGGASCSSSNQCDGDKDKLVQNQARPEEVGADRKSLLPFELDKGVLETVRRNTRLGSDLVEAVRRSTGLSYGKSVIAVQTVIAVLGENVTEISSLMDVVAELVHQQLPCESLEHSEDAEKLRSIFMKLCECKDDSQQRSWSLYEDEGMITEMLDQLISILSDANQSICSRVVAEDEYEAVQSLVQYYQMECRTSIRLLLLQVFGSLCTLSPEVVTLLLCSILPLELARDIQTDTKDIQKLCYSSLVLTMILSTGETVPFNHYEHLNGGFVRFLLDHIEVPPVDDANDQVPDMFVNLLLAFNLHFETVMDNIVMKELGRHGTAKTITEKILLLFNREDDPVQLLKHSSSNTNSVIKFLQDLFTSADTARLLYTNDARVMIDIIVRQLSNLAAADKIRHDYLKLVYLIIQNCCQEESLHRSSELRQCFTRISEDEEEASEEDKDIVRRIVNEFPNYFY